MYTKNTNVLFMVSDPDSISSVDTDPYSESGSKRAKIRVPTKEKNIEFNDINDMKCWMFSHEN